MNGLTVLLNQEADWTLVNVNSCKSYLLSQICNLTTCKTFNSFDLTLNSIDSCDRNCANEWSFMSFYCTKTDVCVLCLEYSFSGTAEHVILCLENIFMCVYVSTSLNKHEMWHLFCFCLINQWVILLKDLNARLKIEQLFWIILTLKQLVLYAF